MPLQPTELTIAEYICTARLEKLLSARVITVEEKKQLRDLQTQQTALNYYAIKYRYSPNSLNKSGRLGRSGGQLPKEIRKYLANGRYHDLDFVNCQPHIILQLCQKNGIPNSSLEEYCNNRAEVLAQFKVDKTFINIAHFSEDFETEHVLFKNTHKAVYNHLIPKLQLEYAELWQHVCDLRSARRSETNLRGSFLSVVAQTIENKCLLAMKDYLEYNGREIGALIYDGLHVLKLEDEEEGLDPSMVQECEAFVEEETGYEMQLTCKPMENSRDWLQALEATVPRVIVEDNEYFSPRTAVELWNNNGEEDFTEYMNVYFAKIVHEKSVYISSRLTPSRPWLHRKIEAVKAAYNQKIPWGPGSKPPLRGIIAVWDEMPDQHVLNNIVFDPHYIGADPDGKNLNTFYGFAANLIPENDIDHELIRPILQHINLLNNNNPRESAYVIKWLAVIIQKPYLKSEVSLVFVSGQGAGKSWLFDVFYGQKIIGREKHYVYARDIKDFTGQFNSGSSCKLFGVGDEVCFAGNFKDNDAMKSLITQGWQRMESKGLDAIMVRDYCNYVLLSNKDEPLHAEEHDRRYFVQRVRRIMPRDYFKTLSRVLDDPRAPDHFFSFLSYLDLTDFDPRIFPMTQEKQDMTERGLKPFDLFCRALLAGEVPVNYASPEDIDNDQGDIAMYEPGQTYATTMSHLYDRFKGHCQFLGVDMSGRIPNVKVFGSSIRNKFIIMNRSTNRNGGTKINIKIAVPGDESTSTDSNSDKENRTPRQRARRE